MARYVTLGDLVSVILVARSMWTGLVSRGFSFAGVVGVVLRMVWVLSV
jgi:hypothetical protein